MRDSSGLSPILSLPLDACAWPSNIPFVLVQMIEAPLPKVPVEVGVVPHWLAIDGAQPNVPQHPPADKQRVKRKRAEASQPVSTKQRRETGDPPHSPLLPLFFPNLSWGSDVKIS